MNSNNSAYAVFHEPGQSDLPGHSAAQVQVRPCLYPAPPCYVKVFSDENVKSGRTPKPPRPPEASEAYTMYGKRYQEDEPIITPLEAQGIKRVYPRKLDIRLELKKLNHSILVNYLDLLKIVIVSPRSSKRQEKLKDISLLFINMHHLVNEFRPHQARETLKLMMEEQKRDSLDVSDRFQKDLDKALEIIQKSLSNIPEQKDSLVKDQGIASDYKEEKQSLVTPEDQMMCDIADMLDID